MTEFWTYQFPLDEAEQRRLIKDLGVIAPLMRQAQKNLTGNARELWIAGIRNIRSQRAYLDVIARQVDSRASKELTTVIDEAKTATDELIQWLESEAQRKDGPSGIGKENYTWYQQNVHLVPLTWEDEERASQAGTRPGLVVAEARGTSKSASAHSSSQRQLPQNMTRKPTRRSIRFMTFLKEQEIVTVTNYMEPALRSIWVAFVPEAQRNFFWITRTTIRSPLFTHFYHWFELARMDRRAAPEPGAARGPALQHF